MQRMPQNMTYDIHEYLRSTREHFASYHNHKEQMAFAATGLYIGGVTALIAQEKLEWIQKLPAWVWLPVVLGLGITTLLFAWWQLSMREYAAKVIEACDNIRTVWLNSPPDQAATNATTYDGKVMPQVLAGELSIVSKNKTENRKRATPRLLTSGIIIAWSIFLIVRILYST
jgi:hypothetical protein